MFKHINTLRIFQFLICSLGIFSLFWAYSSYRFRDVEGFFNGGFCLPVSIGIALFVMGFAVKGRIKRSAFWFSLALVGQAVALQMIEAGSVLRFQHYKPIGRLLTETSPFFLIFLVLQTAFVLAGLKNIWSDIYRWIKSHFKVWQILSIALVFFFYQRCTDA